MAHFEIEIKSLLGSKDRADELRKKLSMLPEPARLVRTSSQLNHYFVADGDDAAKLFDRVVSCFSGEKLESLRKILTEGKNHSVRTRQMDGTVFLVVKASIDDTTSSNGISRMEFEEPVDMTLDELDRLLLEAGFEYQAKWSRDREEYEAGGVSVCLDRNAGYGYLAEFERIVHDATEAEAAKADLLAFMASIGAEELPQDRLERMFAHYNAHWPEYYGTEKIFTIE